MPRKKQKKTQHILRTMQRESLQKRFEQQHIIEKKMQCFVSWTGILLLIFTNFLGALLLVPFLLFFQGSAQYLIIIVFGICFGLLFNLMIHSIEHVEDKHHIIAGVAVPVFALLDVVGLFAILQNAVKTFDMTITYNYTLIVVVFVCAFLIPYIVDIIRQKHRF